MGNIWSTTDNSNAEKQTTSSSKNIEIVQNVRLIWLDSNIDDKDLDCRNTTSQLRRVINTINKYTNNVECIKFLKSISDEKVCMILSGSLGEEMVPTIHNMSQVDSIFIFCRNKEYHENWAKRWSKIKGVFTEITPICDALKRAARQCEHNAISMSFVTTSNTDISTKNLNQLDSSFMYTQIFKEILLTIKFEEEHFKEFIEHCREKLVENVDEMKNIELLERQYRKKTPIWWYSYECFLYPMLNRALRIMDADVIIKMGFFIGDLHRHIDELHSKQFKHQKSSKSFIVYRGQGMSKTDFEQMRKTKGGLMSFNNFLSTSKDRKTSLDFADRALADPDSMGILFVMTIDSSKSTTPFASIAGMSAIPVEDEVLFSTHTVFRIFDIKPMDKNLRLFQVDLTLTDNNDQDLCALTNRMREETKGPSGWYRLGELLRKVGQFDLAQVVLSPCLIEEQMIMKRQLFSINLEG